MKKYKLWWLALAALAIALDAGIAMLLLFGVTYLYAPTDIQAAFWWRFMQISVASFCTMGCFAVASLGDHLKR